MSRPPDSASSPNPYEETLRLAVERLRAADPAEVCRRNGARRGPAGLELEYFRQKVEVSLPEPAGRTAVFRPERISLYEKILILHYLAASGEQAAPGEYVQFKNLPGASFYEPAYRRRGPDRILRRFGGHPQRLLPAAEALGGSRESFGDLSVRLRVFPRVEAVVVLYRGDEEFPPEAGILFRDDITCYLPLEDVAVTAGLIAGRLEKAAYSPTTE